ncbi:MAG: class I SAM-dependent methyltransferase [Cytophagaceae bacterium]|nr:class I SAM-dependent methyltransferase [Cytophagaceae bacterium]
MLVSFNQCPVCEGKKFESFLNCKDHSVSKENFTIVKCSDCNFKFINPHPSEDSIGKYYQSEEYISHSDTKKGLINRAYHFVREITLKKKLKLVNSLSANRTLLDIGCGTGYFLKTCKANGWNVEGTEPDDKARKIAEELTGKELYSSVFSIENNQYDVITMWHVLEHVHKLNETIIKLKVLLRKNGRIVIAVPNCDSKDAKHYKEFWAAYDVPRHLYHFTPETMEKLLTKHGLKLEQTLPMKFDSYYVSLMSEKYLSDNQAATIIKPVLNGWKSNISGMFNNNKYSSIIYVISKE